MATSSDTSGLMVAMGSTAYYTDNFRNAVEDALSVLIADVSTTERTATPDQGLRNKYDFFGLCQEFNIAANLHWVTMRMNGYRSHTEYQGDVLTILVPDVNRVGKIMQIQQTSTIITT